MKVNKNVIPAFQRLLNLIYPPRCPICHDVIPVGQGLICTACRPLPVRIGAPFCMKCGKALVRTDQEYCEDCRRHRHCYDRGRGLFVYDDTMRESIAMFKYNGRREYKKFYGIQMAQAFESQIRRWDPDVLIPIPLHKSRRRKRGFNQAELVAKEMGAWLGLLVDSHVLKRQQKTGAQKQLGQRERRQNMKNAFKILSDVVEYKRVVLIDDIYTTGSTMDAAARILKEKSVEKVYFLCISIGSGC